MNFLGHYFVDATLDNPYYTLGTTLPDIIRGFSKQYRIIKTKNINGISPHFNEIKTGIQRHYQVDEVFHELDLFQDACYKIESIFTHKYRLEVPRMFFIAHILCEFLIDKYIVINYPNIADRYYKLMNSIVKENVIHFFTIHDIDIENMNFSIIFDRFIKNEYAKKLMYNENVFLALSNVGFTHVNFNASELQKKLIINAIEDSDAILYEMYPKILKNVNEKLIYEF